MNSIKFVRLRNVYSVIALLTYLLLFLPQVAFAQSLPITKVSPPQTQSCAQLPPNFDPLQASDSEISQYHLPPRPTNDVVQRSDWVNRMKLIKHIKCMLLSNVLVSQIPNIQTQTPNVQKTGTTSGSFNTWYAGVWSGYLDKDSGGIDDVKGNWNTQCIPTAKSGSREGTWIGIGGIDGRLVQAGTFYGHDNQYHFFLQFTPAGASLDFSSSFGCGIGIHAEVYKDTQYNEWCTWVQQSNGSSSDSTCFDSSNQPDWSTAEWIDERPSCSNGTALLTDFRYTDFSNTYAHSPARNWHTIGGFEYHAVQMQKDPLNASPVFATPNALNTGDTSFRDVWKDFGDGVSCANL